MAVFHSEERLRMRRVRSEKAIQLAAQNRWQEAVDVNRQILEAFPKDVDAHNRLGKALMEIGAYADARDAYGQAAQIDPSNTIAAKNLARLSKLAEEAPPGAVAPPSAPVDPRLFIEESGKTAVTNLVDVASFEKIATLTAGDKMEVQVEHGVVRVVDPSGQVVGQLEPKIAQRVIKLSELGNRYAAAITSIDESHVRVIIREVFRHPSLGSRPSFPTRAPEVRPYTKDSVFRTDFDEDDDDLADEADAEPGDAPEAALDDGPGAEESANDDD